MLKYLRLIGVSYMTRKILCVKMNHAYQCLESTWDGTEDIGILAGQLWEKNLGQAPNFCMDYNKYYYMEQSSTYHAFYIWVFSCTEDFPESSVAYQWIDIHKADISGGLKEYIKKYIHRSIIIKFDCNGSSAFIPKTSRIQGSKQAFSRIYPLKLLHPEIKLENVPNILDAYYMNSVLKKSEQTSGEFVIDESVCSSWGIINMLPMLLYKHQKVVIKKVPEGCQIGQRTLDLYLYIMRMFGIHIDFTQESVILTYDRFNDIPIIEIPIVASFTATSMAIYLAILGNGTTIIQNASTEPEILFLLHTLVKLGYEIKRDDRMITIQGLRNRANIQKQTIKMPLDRNVLVTQIADAIYEEKEYHITGDESLYLNTLIDTLKEFGIQIAYTGKTLSLGSDHNKHIFPKSLMFGHYPELCTDWQPLLAILCCTSSKEIILYDKIFDDRYKFLDQLRAIYPDFHYAALKHMALITNKNGHHMKHRLGMEHFPLLDIRAAAALIIALRKCTDYYLDNITQLLRGYESLFQVTETGGMEGKYEFAETVSQTI